MPTAATFTCASSSTVAACADASSGLSSRSTGHPAGRRQGREGHPGQARSNASHRPGPRVITGALRNSILVMGGRSAVRPCRFALAVGAYRWSSIIAPTVIYGRIQELGGNVYPHHMARSGSGVRECCGWAARAMDRTTSLVSLPAAAPVPRAGSDPEAGGGAAEFLRLLGAGDRKRRQVVRGETSPGETLPPGRSRPPGRHQ